MRIVVYAVLLLCLTCALALADFSGPVVSILDGDTLEVLHNNKAERIRLSGIDCPEKGQAYGKRAKQAASKLVFGKQVTIQTHGYDKYMRTLADVLLPDGMNLNQELVRQGWCWWYRKYAPGDTVLEELEKAARKARKGLWADPLPVPPWLSRFMPQAEVRRNSSASRHSSSRRWAIQVRPPGAARNRGVCGR